MTRAASPIAMAVLLAAAPSAGQSSPRGETSEAREQARLCERLDKEEGLVACRRALALGIGPERRGPVREKIAQHLVDLEWWVELAEHYREGVRLEPGSAEAWLRLGTTLLFAVDQKAEALAALQEAVRLEPENAMSRVMTALALHDLGRYQESTALFDEALSLDPSVLDGFPAAQVVREAALRGEEWP